MRFTVLAALLIGAAGCGPLFMPMTLRLTPEDLRQIDRVWDNMLTPVHRVDRTTLLDATVAFWMYTIGVDRLYMRSEKYFSGGTVVMEIDCDAGNPDVDQYTITVLDKSGRTLRKERYSRADVEQSQRMMTSRSFEERLGVKPEFISPTTRAYTQATSGPAAMQPESAEERSFRLESERRRAAIMAATQPARVGGASPLDYGQER